MKTITIQIGNTDNKLSQQQWSEFHHNADIVIRNYATEVHFFGGSENWKPWQNLCWVVTAASYMIGPFKISMATLGAHFGQDSVAWTEGETRFL